eukprot:CAMPEP_0119357956 /NCGR_PEP_ID=MMETSP1334-20130426/6257_1 /TAXON_ID=127549 /ORGANISM="Calcidiscus leptoporus, Strain RCC1130" /LENGTH=1049 /DNA_ID=CAMNT_0007372323 /DNA_START=84 /DNA_END=3233 /DNA_ORIENTATION=+
MGCAGSTNKELGEEKQGYDEQEEEYQPLTQEEVNARIVACDQTQLFTLGKTNFVLRYAYLSQRGYYPDDLYKNNQDSFKVIPNFNDDPNAIFFGVFDGHGSDGDACSYFVRDNIERHLKTTIAKYPEDFERAYKEAFVNVNIQMHDQAFDDTMSGTTAITCYFNGTEVFVANIGDSRAVIGEKKGKRVIAYSLSIDQTPYRQDERERVKAAGAVIMSCDQLEGIVEYHENWNVALGDELDNGGDPPRVWAPGKSFPGCAFTRSIGDSVAETIGVFAEPELLCKEVTEDDKFIVVASDGVWEFLTNQTVAEMICKFTEPLDACRAVVAEAYRLWLQYEVRTDDITMILAFIDGVAEVDEASGEAVDRMQGRRKSSRRESRRGSADSIFLGLDVVRAGGENRPVRRGLSKEKRQAMTVAESTMSKDEDKEYVPVKVPKSEGEISRIRSAVKANFLFQHLNEQQTQLVFDVMKRRMVKNGEVVIKQGDPGDDFYVVESGEYSVLISQGDAPGVEVMKYSTAGGTNPCFGELALMYSKPRAATVKALSDGQLWAMDRQAFRHILMKSSSTSLMKTLRSVDVLKSLSVGQLQRLSDVLTEVTYKSGEYVIRQGDYTETFYIIMEGKAIVTKKEDPDSAVEPEQRVMQLQEGQYFGERALIEQVARAANVVADGRLKCLYISKDAFEEVLGPLQAIIDEDRKWREKVAKSKQLQQEAEGLNNVKSSDFEAQAVPVATDCGRLVIATNTSTLNVYTVKVASKAKVVQLGQQSRIMSEKALFASLVNHHAYVPLALGNFMDNSCLYTVFKVRIVMELSVLLESVGTCDESMATFYAANVLLALQHLHNEGICYRNLAPDNLFVDRDGFVQLMDFRFAVKLDGTQARDYCGLATYLAPEQVAGTGHGLPVDYWALGILIYEMLTGTAPWLTGDPTRDSELNVYSRITAFKGDLDLPKEMSTDLQELLSELLMPNPNRRIGTRGAGAEEVQRHQWFSVLNMEEMRAGTIKAPYTANKTVEEVSKTLSTPEALAAAADVFKEPTYSGDSSWSDGFVSFKS